MKEKVLIIVAHPDDETIWIGGTILKNSENWDLTIISLCRGDDPDRAPKFRKVCEIYKAKSFISDLEDETLKPISITEVIKRIKQFAQKEYDYIYTHNTNGEYGHIRHIDVHKAVLKMLDKGDLSTEKLFLFDYENVKDICCAKKTRDKFIKLDNLTLKRKKEIINEVYGFSKESFEYKCSRDKEAFIVKNIK